VKRVVSLFSGGGGLDIGLEAAGFETLLSTDIDPYSCNTLEANKVVSKQRGKPFLSDTIILQSDIANLTPKRILDLTGQKKGEVDLLSGGPPCQAFSVFGKRKGTEDPRGLLAFQYLRILKSIEPKAFIFENVPGLLTIDNGSIFELLKKKLSSPSKKLNYSISVLRLNAVIRFQLFHPLVSRMWVCSPIF
jgi:DNA (cytosine-5)-methyltransferase 1